MYKLRVELLVATFITIGLAAVALSLLSNELLQDYQRRRVHNAQKLVVEKLSALNADYKALLEKIDSDPNITRRLLPATLGIDYREPNTAYPELNAEYLAAAKKSLETGTTDWTIEPQIPAWLKRTNKPLSRTFLFLAGSCLVLIGLVCFPPRLATGGSDSTSRFDDARNYGQTARKQPDNKKHNN